MAIYITGDTHGDFDRIEEFCELYGTTQEDDIIIILGDAGINYSLGDRDIRLKEQLSLLPITLFCVHGNHEEHPYNISTYEEKEWHDGMVYFEEKFPNILFAGDGEIYDFNGNKAVVIGGAYSVDKFYRLSNGMPWFESEQPDDRTIEYVESNLEKAGWKVDFVFSHTCPLKYVPTDEFLPTIDQSTVDQTTEIWLDSIEERLGYEKWFCGHFHCDRQFGKGEIMYEEIEELLVDFME